MANNFGISSRSQRPTLSEMTAMPRLKTPSTSQCNMSHPQSSPAIMMHMTVTDITALPSSLTLEGGAHHGCQLSALTLTMSIAVNGLLLRRGDLE